MANAIQITTCQKRQYGKLTVALFDGYFTIHMGCTPSKNQPSDGQATSENGKNTGQRNEHQNGSQGKLNGFASRFNDANIEKKELTEELLDEYVKLEKEIYVLEQKNVTKKMEDRILQADELKKTIDQLEATCKELKKQTDKEKADVENIEQPTVRAFLKQQGTYEKKLASMQECYKEALGRQEVAEKEMAVEKAQYEKALKIVDINKKRVDRLTELYDKQDKLLGKVYVRKFDDLTKILKRSLIYHSAAIFGGKYGSELENQLEGQLDDSMEWQQRVALAKFKWANARVLLVHACTQMAFGIKRWKEVQNIDRENTRMRYFAAAEARNNFIAASQNIESARVYLGKVKFPYCTEDEIEKLEQCLNNSFSDLQSPDKMEKSTNTFMDVHRKAAALIHIEYGVPIDTVTIVIKETILKDLELANDEVTECHKKLRKERLTLINGLVKERLGHELVIEHENINEKDPEDEELLALESEKVPDDSVSADDRLNKLLTLSQPDGRFPTPLPANELAAIPTSEALFGEIKTN
uniref:Uncharacterized protein n=1 Tax=Romanomermis culicivorax TaxID=13658 RepID=A0A915KKL4_ROMCU